MHDPDVLVVGSGPGGCAAALQAASGGRRVTLIETRQFPRYRPGETLHPGVEPLLERLGAGAVLHNARYRRHGGTWVRWRGPLRFVPFGGDGSGPWRGYQAPGEDFDCRLREAARRRGVALVDAAAHTPLLDAGHVVGVDSSLGPITARIVIDASGRRHWLARQLRLAIRHHSPRLFVVYGYARGRPRRPIPEPLLTSEPGGWSWIARIEDAVHHWTRLRVAPRVPSRRPPPSLTPCELVGKVAGADVRWRSVCQAAGPGYFVVGDAAAVLDPASGHGVLRAIMSGMMAGFLAERILSGQTRASDGEVAYRQWLHAWVGHDTRTLSLLYAEADRLGPSWRRLQAGLAGPPSGRSEPGTRADATIQLTRGPRPYYAAPSPKIARCRG